MHHRTQLTALLLVAAGAAACGDEPIYIASGLAIEVTGEEEDGAATGSVTLPIRLEREDEATDRAALAAELGIDVPYVTRDDLDVEVEWVIRNLDAEADATVRVQVNGANEMFVYLPPAFVFDPEEEEEPPPLMGDIPYVVPPLSDRGGVLREDQLAEAALDLELITRGAVTPFATLLTTDEERTEFPLGGSGAAVPASAWAGLVRLDFIVIADRHVVFEYSVRARDHRSPELLHGELTDAPAEELTAFAPVDFQPPPPAEEDP